MNRAKEAVKIMFNRSDCPILDVIHDCGKCPYLELDNEVCDATARAEVIEMLNKVEDLP